MSKEPNLKDEIMKKCNLNENNYDAVITVVLLIIFTFVGLLLGLMSNVGFTVSLDANTSLAIQQMGYDHALKNQVAGCVFAMVQEAKSQNITTNDLGISYLQQWCARQLSGVK